MAYYITEKCIGCTMCARLCPVSAISGEKKERHEINPKRCVECGVCGRACPQGAITAPDGTAAIQVPRSKWQKPVIDTGICSACAMCVSVCTAGALEIKMPEKRGDINVYAVLANPKKCVGCALCQRECPLEAITMKEAE